MKHLRRFPLPVLLVLVVLCGLAAIVAGIYLLLGLAVALIAGGALAVAAGLLVDVD